MDEAVQKAIADNLRFYGDARFKQLTLFLTGMTLLTGGFFQFGENKFAVEMGVKQVVPTAAMFVTAVFWILEIRGTLFWCVLRDHCPDLWPAPPTDSWSFLNGTVAVFALYLASYMTWYAAGIKVGTACWILFPLAALGILVLCFGVCTYAKCADLGSVAAHGG